ncbi:MAG: GNAT family N-acetyltransferase [Clostridia bacterium]|nr:GNAT family N-acetyltransferase [Clostridia bacterium]
MTIKKYEQERDYERIHEFLTEQYNANKNMICWLPQRFDDLVFRIDALHHEERGKEKSSDYIFIFEENEEIVGLILPDGDSFNSSIKKGYEYVFPQMIDLAEKELQPLFEKDENGEIDFLIVSHDSLKYQAEELEKRGYTRDEAGDFDNVSKPLETNYKIELLEGFKQVYGYDYPDIVKMRACHYGFHPEDDDGDLYKEYAEGGKAYHARKKSKFFKDSFESLIITESGDVCAYSFCYVDKETSTAFVEPVSTREKYRKKGLCKAMMHGIINKCKDMGIERAYVNSYDWRKKVYNSAGFETEDSIGFWHKKICVK